MGVKDRRPFQAVSSADSPSSRRFHLSRSSILTGMHSWPKTFCSSSKWLEANEDDPSKRCARFHRPEPHRRVGPEQVSEISLRPPGDESEATFAKVRFVRRWDKGAVGALVALEDSKGDESPLSGVGPRRGPRTGTIPASWRQLI